MGGRDVSLRGPRNAARYFFSTRLSTLFFVGRAPLGLPPLRPPPPWYVPVARAARPVLRVPCALLTSAARAPPLQPLRLDIKRELSARSDRVKCVDLHPTEPWVLAALYNGHVFLWNYATQTVVKTFELCELPSTWGARAGRCAASL